MIQPERRRPSRVACRPEPDGKGFVRVLAILCGLGWFENAFRTADIFQIVFRTPFADRQTSEKRCSQGGGFNLFGTIDGHFQEIGLELHEEIVSTGPAIHAQFIETLSQFLDTKQVADLKGDAFERSSDNMFPGGSTSQADNCPARIGIPIGRTKADKRWYEKDSGGVWYLTGNPFTIRAFFDEPCAVPQPLNSRTRCENRSL